MAAGDGSGAGGPGSRDGSPLFPTSHHLLTILGRADASSSPNLQEPAGLSRGGGGRRPRSRREVRAAGGARSEPSQWASERCRRRWAPLLQPAAVHLPGARHMCISRAFPELSSSSGRRRRALQAMRAWACQCQKPSPSRPTKRDRSGSAAPSGVKPLKCTLSVQRPDHAAPGPTGRPDHAAPRPRRGPQLWTRGARTERRPDDGPSAGPIAWTLRRYTGSLISWPGWIGRGRPGFAARSASVVSR